MNKDEKYCENCEFHFKKIICNDCKNGNCYSKLYNADKNCKHKIVSTWNGIRCEKCNGWFCF